MSHTLNKARQDLTPCLQQRMPGNNLEEPLQSFPSMLNHIITEAVRKDLSGQRRDRHARRFPLEDIAEVFKVRVSTTDDRMLQLESRDVGAADDFIGSVHVARCAMSLRIAHLNVRRSGISPPLGPGTGGVG